MSETLHWRQGPVTAVVVAIAFVVFLLTYVLGLQSLVPWFTFLPVEVRSGSIVFYEMGQQYWRLVSPIFLHFGVLHIVFNSLWVWEFGKRTESVLGHLNQAGLILAIALVSNGVQYLASGPSIFGGLSGVVYGLLGFAWVAPMVTNWMGDNGFLRKLDVQVRAPGLYGDIVTYEGSVTEKDEDRAAVTIDITGTNQSGQVSTKGTAIVELPRK